MADNVGYTPGVGATVAADDISGVLHQRVKISLGADGTAVDAPGDGTNGMKVDVTRVAGNVQIGDGTNAVAVDTAPADAETNTVNGLQTLGRAMGYNGATWDRVRGNVATFRSAQYTTAQTGVALWTPAAGKAVVVTSMQIQSFGTTAGTAVVWFGGTADATYTRGTDGPLFDGEFAPSGTNKPGVYVTHVTPIRGAADFVLRVTTTNAQSITVTVWGYEI
jgi:hypothetical protein